MKRSAIAAIFAIVLAASSLMVLNAAPLRAADRTQITAAIDSVKTISTSNVADATDQLPPQVEELKKKLPLTYEDADSIISTKRNKYLMWTKDLTHIMWGVYGAGHFVGTDNLDKRAWGIYGNGYFAGFYYGHFFWGKYSNSDWKAQGLFGMRSCNGRYTLAPTPAITAATP